MISPAVAVHRADSIRDAPYGVYKLLPRGISIWLKEWSDSVWDGELIRCAERTGSMQEYWEVLSEASYYRACCMTSVSVVRLLAPEPPSHSLLSLLE